MKHTKTVCILGILTALYVVLSAFCKVNLIGNIMLDFGYVAFAVALCKFGPIGTVVGVVGCALESILFSAYGFSISWVVANASIGIGFGFACKNTENIIARIAFMLAASLLGLLVAKTGIECILYKIPLLVKIPKNVVAWIADSVMMVFGIFLEKRLKIK